MKEVDNYIEKFPDDISSRLLSIRELVHPLSSDVKETMSYGVPSFNLNGYLCSYAAFKNHVGLYPTPSGIESFKEKLKGYKTLKGSIHFPHKEELPLDLIREILQFRIKNKVRSRFKCIIVKLSFNSILIKGFYEKVFF